MAQRLGIGWGKCKRLSLREMRLILFARTAMLDGSQPEIAIGAVSLQK